HAAAADQGGRALVMGVLIAVFGAIFAAAGAVKMLRMAEARSFGRRAIGRVVRLELEAVPEPGHQRAYTPVVEFEAEGRRVQVKGWRSFPPGYQVGEEVVVYYAPGHPEAAQFVSGREWWIAGCFLAGGVAFVLFGVAVAVSGE